MTTTTHPRNGSTMTIATEPGNQTGDHVHYFPAGTRVKVIRDNAQPARRDKPAIPAHRWLCRGKSVAGSVIDQWLRAEDLTA